MYKYLPLVSVLIKQILVGINVVIWQSSRFLQIKVLKIDFVLLTENNK